MISLAPLLVLTDREQAQAAGRSLDYVVACAVAAGARTVLLREKDLPRAARHEIAGRLLELLRPVDAALVVASDLRLARDVGAAAVHLSAQDAWPSDVERAGITIGSSCHDATSVLAARYRGATYMTLSPIFPTASKPGYGPALGPDALAGHRVPVYALGGVTVSSVRECLGAGASGVALMGGVMGCGDPTATVRGVLAEIRAATVVLVHGGLGEIDANKFWAATGVTGALEAAGWRVLAPDRIRFSGDWGAEGRHLARLGREPSGLTVVAGSNGCSAAVRLALDFPDAVGRLVLCWPATVEDATIRGVADAELRTLDAPVCIVPAAPEDPFHRRTTVDRLAGLVRGAVVVDGCPPAPRPDFAPALDRFVAAITSAASP